MRGLLLVNAYGKTDTRQVRRFTEEFSRRGVEVDVRNNNTFSRYIKDGAIAETENYDFCLYLDKDKYVARLLEKCGMRLFDRADTIELCDDKMLTHIALAGHGIPMPDTVPGLLCYDSAAHIDENTIDTLISKLGLPMIVKESYGSLGKGVYKADTKAQLTEIASEIKLRPHLFQKYIASSEGRDMRVIVIGGKVVGGILRKSDTDFRSNIGLGARAEKTTVPTEVKDIAEKTATLLGADYCGIDFLFDKTPLVCEVNSNAFFDAFEEVTGVNVAGKYVEHIIKSL